MVLGDNASLFRRTLTARELNLIPVERLDAPLKVWAKVRYRMAPQPAVLEQTGPDTALVTFEQPQRAISSPSGPSPRGSRWSFTTATWWWAGPLSRELWIPEEN